ncbi:tight junction-associated protein 1 [Oryzias latipes]|uniref:tight junction-associated protein 1 n=1 Tax=Oryzias latipes TaxID=8090 RepID=UPI0009D9719C|nr:tight junction-associated protein 1 [Oryzias latipes]
MSSATPARKPYRKAPPQHRETRHAPSSTPPPPPQPDVGQVNKCTSAHHPKTPVLKVCPPTGFLRATQASPPSLSDSELEVSSLSSLDFQIPPPPLFSGPLPPANRTRTTPIQVSEHLHRPAAQRDDKSSDSKRSRSLTRQHRREAHSRNAPTVHCAAPKSILKQPAGLGVASSYNNIRKTKSVELLDGADPRSLAKAGPLQLASPNSSAPPSPCRTNWNWRMQVLEDKVRFSHFLDEITHRVLSPARLSLLGKSAARRSTPPSLDRLGLAMKSQQGESAHRSHRWDHWVASLQRSDRWSQSIPEEWAGSDVIIKEAGHQQKVKKGAKIVTQATEDQKHKRPLSSHSLLTHIKEVLSDADRIRILQQQNEDLRRRLSLSTQKMEAMEAEFDSSRHYMEAELSRTRDDLDKMRDKFRRLQNSYTASQRANQDLEEKLHALAAVSQTWVHALRKVERDKKTMDQEIVELTNKLLDAKNTIDRLEELNERYRQDCNLAVQLLKCNKSHFRNHKFADLPSELQDMLNKHMKSSLPEPGSAPGNQDPDTLSLTPADVVPTSVIARVLEKPEPLVLNSAQSSSCGRPVAEDVFVHVDMTCTEGGAGPEVLQQNGSCLSNLDEEVGGVPSFEKLNPYPAPLPPHPLYPGRKVIEFSSDDKVKIPKNSPLPNCTYATRQAISLSLVQNDDERQMPGSPAQSCSGGVGAAQRTPPSHHDAASEPLSSQSSPFSSPPQAPSVLASSGSSEEDLLASWQRMFVEKMAPPSDGSLLHRTAFSSQTAQELQKRRQVVGGGASATSDRHRAAYSDGEEGSSARSWTPSRGSSLDTDTDTEPRSGRRGGLRLK